jgi:hypothetical protein
MRRLAAAAAFLVALLTGAAAASGAVIGANDDSAKYAEDGGAALYSDMTAVGLQQTVIGVRFVPSEAMQIQGKEALDRGVASALDAGLRVVLAVYPYPPREIEAGLGSPAAFGAYVSAVARAFPQVRQFVLGNEPNQPAFWRPQFGKSGANASAAAFGPYLAAGYDALKAIDPEVRVVGIGLSPRGNDKPYAKSNISTSPIRFLRALGEWYRASGRSLPLMDAFSFHPYPNASTDPLERGYGWPNAGFVNLDRVKQALWDAFRESPQPTTLRGLKLHLDEVGWQVDTSRHSGYVGAENVAVTDELTQAAIYGDLIRRAACDPDIESVSFFGFRDDSSRIGFQAALHRADGSVRPAAAAVKAAIEQSDDGCAGEAVAWKPAGNVVGARVDVGTATGPRVRARIRAGEDARVRVCVQRRGTGLRGARVRLTRVAGQVVRARCASRAVVGFQPLDVVVERTGLRPRSVELAVRLEAEANRRRPTLILRKARLAP